MALNVACGSFTLASGIGTQSVTGLSFQPRVVLLWWTNVTTAGFRVMAHFGFGVSTDEATDQHRSHSYSAQDNVATTATAYGKREAQSWAIREDNLAGYHAWGTISAFNSDGFTVNRQLNTDTRLAIINYTAIGGTDLTNAALVQLQAPGATGNNTYTGVGFQGDLVVLWSNRQDGVSGNSTGGTSSFQLGVANGSQQAVLTGTTATSSTNTGINQGKSRLSASKCFYAYETTPASASFVGFTSDGFTLNHDVASTNYFSALVLQGTFQSHIGVQSRPTSNGNQVITSPGFTPTGLLLGGTIATAVDTDTAQQHFLLGAGDGTNQQTAWAGDAATINTDTNAYLNSGNVYTQATNPSTIAAQASLSSLDASGYTLNWGTTDGNARQFMHVALGSAATESPSTTARGLVRTYV